MFTTPKRYSETEIREILDKVQHAVAVTSYQQGFSSVLIYVPDYFRHVMNAYFSLKHANGTRGVEFGTGNSFFGVKNFFPSPNNTIIISCLKNAQNENNLETIIKLK